MKNQVHHHKIRSGRGAQVTFPARSAAAAWVHILVLAVIALLAPAPSVSLAKEPPPVESFSAVAERLSDAFRQATGIVQSSVVSITAEASVPVFNGGQLGLPRIPDEFRRFFGDDLGPFFDPSAPGKRGVRRGFGSGVIVSSDGYILTNNHVVAGAETLSVQLQNESTYKAKVVGTDPKTELAVIKIDAADLTVARLADSEKVRIGDWVLAIGGPFGLKNTVTAGIVSAKGRDTVGIADYENFIQTDAAINPGNSGGPLINMRGEVIGINTAIATRSGSNAGVGFSIPSNMAGVIMQSLIKNGHVARGFLGALIQNLTPELASSFGFKGKHGVLIGDISADGPADKAKLKAGDIITKFNGEWVNSSRQLRNRVASTAPGTKIELELFREGRSRTVQVVLGRLNEGGGADPGSGESMEAEKLGLEATALTAELASELGLKEGQTGVVITKITPQGLAERSGLEAADVIVSLNGKAVSDIAGFKKELARSNLKRGIRLQVISNGLKRYLFIMSR